MTVQLVLTDLGYPLWEMRPLDRHVYVLTLEGDWKSPPDRDAAYYVNIEFPDGGTAAHRPTIEALGVIGKINRRRGSRPAWSGMPAARMA